MKTWSFILMGIMAILPRGGAKAEENCYDSTTLAGSLIQFVGAVYSTAAIHEFGHYKEAESLGLSPEISLGLIESKAVDGSFSFYLGTTSYAEIPRDSDTASRLALTGMEFTGDTYENLHEEIRNGEVNSRFSSMVALLCKTDFARYALLNSLRSSSHEYDDIDSYSTNSGIDKDFIYTAAVLDVLFSWSEIKFHAGRIAGRNPEVPRRKEILGLEAKPTVFVRKDMGVAIGFGLKKRW